MHVQHRPDSSMSQEAVHCRTRAFVSPVPQQANKKGYQRFAGLHYRSQMAALKFSAHGLRCTFHIDDNAKFAEIIIHAMAGYEPICIMHAQLSNVQPITWCTHNKHVCSFSSTAIQCSSIKTDYHLLLRVSHRWFKSAC